MFHIHVCGTERPGDRPVDQWLFGYDGSKYSNKIMGKWFKLYKRRVKTHILFINHPLNPA